MKQKILCIFLGILWGILAFFGMRESVFAEQGINKIEIITPASVESDTDFLNKYGGRSFYDKFSNYFVNGSDNQDSAYIFEQIANGIKVAFIAVAGIFLMIAIFKLLFSEASDEDVRKWRKNIIWVTVGIFLMQISITVWKILFVRDASQTSVDSNIAINLWKEIVLPIVGILQFLASFAFLAMMIYGFYKIITGAGDTDKLEKSKMTFIYAVAGFLLIQLPRKIVNLLYGSDLSECRTESLAGGTCNIEPEIQRDELVKLAFNVLKYFNGFLSVFCVIMVIYAGFLLLTSNGDEDKLKTTKNILLYTLIGFIVLIASHAIVRFVLVPNI